MNGRLVRKTLSFSKQQEMLKTSSVWEDLVYNLTRPVKTLRLEVNQGNCRFQPRSPAMAAGLTDHMGAALLGRRPEITSPAADAVFSHLICART